MLDESKHGDYMALVPSSVKGIRVFKYARDGINSAPSSLPSPRPAGAPSITVALVLGCRSAVVLPDLAGVSMVRECTLPRSSLSPSHTRPGPCQDHLIDLSNNCGREVLLSPLYRQENKGLERIRDIAGKRSWGLWILGGHDPARNIATFFYHLDVEMCGAIEDTCKLCPSGSAASSRIAWKIGAQGGLVC